MKKTVIDHREIEKLSESSQRAMHIILEELDGVRVPVAKNIPRIEKLCCQIKRNTVFSSNQQMTSERYRHSINDAINKINVLIDRIHKLEDEVGTLRKEKSNDDE